MVLRPVSIRIYEWKWFCSLISVVDFLHIEELWAEGIGEFLNNPSHEHFETSFKMI